MKWWLLLQCLLLKAAGLILLWRTDLDALGVCLFFAGGFWVVAHMLIPGWQGMCDVVRSFRPTGKEVWLTIDDGPDPVDTPQLLELLDRYEAKATFFMIGRRAARNPELVKEVLRRGHSIGCHTHTHPTCDFWYAGRKRVAHELDRALSVLNQPGRVVRLYRSPVGIKNFFLAGGLKRRGLVCVAWTVRSGDGVGKNPDAIVAHSLKNVRPGAILLMHEGPDVAPEVRVRAIERVLEGLRTQGYRCILPSVERLSRRRTERVA
ncbi:polysaccharide deacetylase family protein [Coraliomargarita parva]|uniref:polysaccharide deacetylase family protein n=1 Tax=Coraliomargarita parva TaxID=3014050 RepID=UPI0022B5B49B|nr:polysaccharide deacetylase family protein [Coraliomargarita parva]